MKMRTIFIYMLLDDLKIKICNDALSYIHRNDDYVRESTLDDYLEKIYKEQYSRKMSYTILLFSLLYRRMYVFLDVYTLYEDSTFYPVFLQSFL